MSNPSQQDLQAEIQRLSNELQQLRQVNQIDLKALSSRWFQLIHRDELNNNKLVQILGELSSQIGAYSAAFYLYDADKQLFQMSLSFPLVDETILKEGDTTINTYPYIASKLLSGQNIVLRSLDDLPDDSEDKKLLQAANQQNLISIPVLHNGKLQATLDIHSGKEPKNWHDDAVEAASLAAHLILQGIQQLESNLFHQWFDESSQALSKVSNLETIEYCLQGLAKLLDIDGINLLVPNHRVEDDNSRGIKVSCCFPNIPEDELEKTPIHLSEFPWTYQQVIHNHIVSVNDIEELPPEAKTDQDLLREGENYSYMIVPLHHNNQMSALIDLYTVGRKHRWTSRETDYVKKVLPLLFTAYEQLQLQKRRQESLSTLQKVLAATDVGYCIINEDLSEYFFSDSTARLMGHPDSQVITPDWIINHLLWDKKTQDLDTQSREMIFKEGRASSQVLKIRTAENHPKWLLVNYTINTYKRNGDVETMLVGFSDLSNQVTRQKALKKARIEADEANAAKSDFLARMSHEIRTPMNAIIGMTHLIQDTALNDKQKEQVTHIDQAAQNLLGIINDILDFSKIESGKLELETTDFDFPSLLEQVVQVVSFHSKSHDQELILDIDNNTPKRLKGDPLRITQILTNLLSNAVKFTRKGNITLKIQAEQQGTNTKLNFVISDQGIGMTQEQIDNLFQPFTQADGSISREFGGTGLGLSIVKRLIELMGSNIKVESTPNVGSTFTFSLNLQEADYEAEQTIELNQLRTLVVDDNSDARQVICNIARSLQLPVTEARSAQQAIDLIHQYNIDPKKQFELVLMDYRMPEIDGLHAAQIIKQDSSLNYIPTVIMVSACDRDEVMKSQLSKYLEGFISKPVSASRLYNSVNHLLYKEHPATPETKKTVASLQGIRVLLVEDNIVNQKVAQGMLKKQGVIATIANNGQEAIDTLMAKKDDFDAVLMDIEMPKVDGYQATAFIREHLNLDIPIIAMTAHAMSTDRDKCLQAGMNDHIHKPIKPELLYKALSTFTAPSTSI